MAREVGTRSKHEFDGQAKGKELPEFLPKIVNCSLEDDDWVQELANKEGVALAAFIAPQVSVRISPIEEARAVIGLAEEFSVEVLVQNLKEAKADEIFLLVNSPGGAMGSSYKIAHAIRTAFKRVTTFIPHVAASGGTLLALAGDEIVMGPMSHITPLDVQIAYKGTRVSATTFANFFTRASRWYEKSLPEETPYPQRALTEQLDPYLMEEWSGVMDAMYDYVIEILLLSGYGDESDRIAKSLVWGHPTHSYVINAKKAGELNLNVTRSVDVPGRWKVMRHWLGKYLTQQEMTHCIRYALPQGGKNSGRRKVQSKRGGGKRGR
jgi:ATP-dependent protease ClpP protease subunit